MSSSGKLSPRMLAGFGKSVEERMIRELGATPLEGFEELLEVRNLAGESTGYVRVYRAEKLVRACAMSVTVMPGGRYFNIHIQPDTRFDLPRFAFEGMITTHGSQVSMDFYPDIDLPMRIGAFLDQMEAVIPIYDDAKRSGIDFQPSRLAHMRALSSPLFLNVRGCPAEQLPQVEEYGNRYFDAWLKLYRAAQEVDADEAADRARRRAAFVDTVIEMDPDRQMIVQVYGEQTTRAIEQAMMRS